MKKYTFLLVFVFITPIFFSVLPQKAEANYLICCGSSADGAACNRLNDEVKPGWIDVPTLHYPLCGKGQVCPLASCGPLPNIPQVGDIIFDLSQALLFFFDNSVNVILPWGNAPEQKTGSTGQAYTSLVTSLRDFGFHSGTISTSYDATTASSVSNLQKALGLTASGVFDVQTRDEFRKFINDTSLSNGAVGNAGDNLDRFGIIWKDKRFSEFSYHRFSPPVLSGSSFAGINLPNFIRKDKDGKVYLWDKIAKRWNPSSSLLFPASSSVKGSLTTLATKLSTISSNIATSFSTARTISSGTSNTAVPAILQFLYNTGFSSYNPVSTANTFGPTSTEATMSLQRSLGLTPSGTFDNTTATAAKTLNDSIISAVNAPFLPTNINGFLIEFPNDKSMSVFNSASGTFIHSAPVTLPTNCGGVKQPPCVGLLTFKCCTADGEWCTTATAGGTCSGTGNSFCGSEGFKCRDVF